MKLWKGIINAIMIEITIAIILTALVIAIIGCYTPKTITTEREIKIKTTIIK